MSLLCDFIDVVGVGKVDRDTCFLSEVRTADGVAPVYTTLMYQYWDIAQLTSYMHMGNTRPPKKTHIAVGAGAH